MSQSNQEIADTLQRITQAYTRPAALAYTGGNVLNERWTADVNDPDVHLVFTPGQDKKAEIAPLEKILNLLQDQELAEAERKQRAREALQVIEAMQRDREERIQVLRASGVNDREALINIRWEREVADPALNQAAVVLRTIAEPEKTNAASLEAVIPPAPHEEKPPVTPPPAPATPTPAQVEQVTASFDALATSPSADPRLAKLLADPKLKSLLDERIDKAMQPSRDAGMPLDKQKAVASSHADKWHHGVQGTNGPAPEGRDLFA